MRLYTTLKRFFHRIKLDNLKTEASKISNKEVIHQNIELNNRAEWKPRVIKYLYTFAHDVRVRTSLFRSNEVSGASPS